jgi:hypothetical protein
LYYDTGLRGGGGAVLPPKIAPQQAPPSLAAPVAPAVRPVAPAVRPVAPADPWATRPFGVTPKDWAGILADRAKERLKIESDAKTVIGLLTGVEDIINKQAEVFLAMFMEERKPR